MHMHMPVCAAARVALLISAAVLVALAMPKIYRGLTVGGAEEAFDAAYRNTDYIVYKLDDALRINEHSQTFDELLRKHGAKLCIFLTAWNPKSQEFSRAENDKRNEELVARVEHLGGFLTLAGEGKARTGDWPPEHSYLIVGTTPKMANQLADEFGQNAYVEYTLGGVAKLVWRQ